MFLTSEKWLFRAFREDGVTCKKVDRQKTISQEPILETCRQQPTANPV